MKIVRLKESGHSWTPHVARRGSSQNSYTSSFFLSNGIIKSDLHTYIHAIYMYTYLN